MRPTSTSSTASPSGRKGVRRRSPGKDSIDAYLQPFVEGIRADADGVLDEIASELPEVDRAIMARQEFRDVIKESFVEAVHQGVRGWADDDLSPTV